MEFRINPQVYIIFFVIILSIVIMIILRGKNFRLTYIESQPKDEGSNVKKIVDIVLFIISGIPLCIYPFVLVANIMSMAGYWSGNGNALLIIAVISFIFLTTTYPLTYILCLVLYKSRKFNSKKYLSVIPLLHLIAVFFLGFIWGKFNN